jgi:hypothetical protein
VRVGLRLMLLGEAKSEDQDEGEWECEREDEGKYSALVVSASSVVSQNSGHAGLEVVGIGVGAIHAISMSLLGGRMGKVTTKAKAKGKEANQKQTGTKKRETKTKKEIQS